MKVAIAVPCLDYVASDFAFSLASVLSARAYDKKLSRDVDIALIHQSGSIIMDARNNLVAQAQAIAATYILFLDSDMTFPPDTLARLIAHHKPIVAATYVKRVEPYQLLGEQDTSGIILPYKGSVLIPMISIPLGCALISMKVFDTMELPYFRYLTTEHGSISEDTFFSDRARKAGFTIWCDPALTREVGHVGKQVFRA